MAQKCHAISICSRQFQLAHGSFNFAHDEVTVDFNFDRSFIREAKDDGRKALSVLREHYQGKGKPRVIALYTERTSLQMAEGESTTDYIIRAKTAVTALKAAEEVISDGLLIAMALKGLPSSYKTFATVVMQREKQMTFAEFKIALRNYEENEKSCNRGVNSLNAEHVMTAKQKFYGKCFRCERKGHKSTDCFVKADSKWVSPMQKQDS